MKEIEIIIEAIRDAIDWKVSIEGDLIRIDPPTGDRITLSKI